MTLTSIEPGAYRGFFAVTPPDDVRAALLDAVADLQGEPWARQVKWVQQGNLHLTVRFMGTRTENDYQHWIEQLQPVLANIDSFEVAIDQITLFPHRRRPVAIAALVPATPELTELVAQVESIVQSRALPERKDYRGHFTLGRCRGRFDRHAEINHPPLNLRFPVTAVDLYRSDTLPEGAVYTRMAQVPLRGMV